MKSSSSNSNSRKTSDARHALAELAGLGCRAADFIPAALELLHEIIPSQRNLFDWCDESGRLTHYFIEGPVDAAVAAHYFAEFHNRREAACMPAFATLANCPGGVRSAAPLQTQQFFDSALYNEIWRPQGLHTRIEGVVRGRRGQLLGSLVLYRGRGEACFGPAEERELAELLPLLARGLAEAPPHPAGCERVRAPEPPGVLLFNTDGQLCQASSQAQRMLLLAGDALCDDDRSNALDRVASWLLPQVLKLMRQQGASASLLLENRLGTYRVRAESLGGLHAGQEARLMVTLARLEPVAVALERALLALPVTPGQRAVCRHLQAGLSHADIAMTLGVAPATVVDHVRKIYRALEIRSALELRALLERLKA